MPCFLKKEPGTFYVREDLIPFDNTYCRLPPHFFAEVYPAIASNPKHLKYKHKLEQKLGIDLSSLSEQELADIFVGKNIPSGANTIAMAYAGHQFGRFVPMLGDGRAILLGEVVDLDKKRYDLQLKGAGQTPYSRRGDGLSALGPVIREYIVSEAMHYLGIPTTRALAAVTTGDLVYREEGGIAGGVFTRVASSHIRVGTFEFFAAQGDFKAIKTLLDYSIKRHYPELEGEENLALLFLQKVSKAQAKLVASWMSVGFIHGVMNTDNFSISGETIDYGPCAFLDNFKFNKVFSFIDRNGRYCYSNQGNIAHWNLSRLANCLIPLVHDDQNQAVEALNNELDQFLNLFKNEWLKKMGAKLGLHETRAEDEILIKCC